MDSNDKRTAKAPVLWMLAGFVIVVAGIKAASSILVPFFLAVFVAVIYSPLFFWLQRKGVPKVLALTLILLAILVAGILFGALIGPSLNDFLKSLPDYQKQLSTHVASWTSWMSKKGVTIPEGGVLGALDPGWVMSLAESILSGLSSVLANAFLILLTAVFILLEAAGFSKKLRSVLKDPEKSLSAH